MGHHQWVRGWARGVVRYVGQWLKGYGLWAEDAGGKTGEEEVGEEERRKEKKGGASRCRRRIIKKNPKKKRMR